MIKGDSGCTCCSEATADQDFGAITNHFLLDFFMERVPGVPSLRTSPLSVWYSLNWELNALHLSARPYHRRSGCQSIIQRLYVQIQTIEQRNCDRDTADRSHMQTSDWAPHKGAESLGVYSHYSKVDVWFRLLRWCAKAHLERLPVTRQIVLLLQPVCEREDW